MKDGLSRSWVVWLGIAAFTFLFTYLSWRKLDAFEYARYDLGNMVQAIWSTLHGNFLLVTDGAGNQVSRLGLHFDPLLVGFVPLFAIWPDPKLLLLSQAAVVAVGALPVYWIARSELADSGRRWVPVVLAYVYLLYPPLQYATLDEFHPVTLALPLLLFAVWFLREGKYWRLALMVLLALASKENVGLAVAALGFYGVFVWRRRVAGVALMLTGLLCFALVTMVLIPHFNGGSSSALLARYQEVGGSAGGIVKSALTDPGKFFSVLFAGNNLLYLLRLLWPLLFLPLAAPFALAVAVPEFVLNMLSSQQTQHSIHFHYVALEAPFLIWATVLGLRRIWHRWPRSLAPLAGVLVAATVVAGWLMGPLPFWSKLPLGSSYKASAYSPDAHDRVIKQALALIPNSVPVSATNQLGSQLSQRQRILVFPQVLGAKYVVLDERYPSFGDARGSSDQLPALEALREDPNFKPVFDRDGVLVFKAE